MKKTVSVLLAILLLASALTGCGRAPAQEPEPASPAPEVTEAPETSAEEAPAGEEVPVIHVIEDGRARPSNSGRLRVIDGRLCGENGDPVMLRGVSSNGLITAEGYLNEECFRELSEDLGVNVFRLAMYTYGVGAVGYCTGGDRDRHKADVALGVELALRHDMYAVVDWHILSDGDPNTYIEDAKLFFSEMAERFADSGNVLYEICNEPNRVDWPAVKAYAEQIIPVIREKDPEAVILVGSPDWSKDLRSAAADPLEFDNVMYTLHFYAATHGREFRDMTQEVCQNGLPVFVTEYGVTASSGGFPRDLESADEWIGLLEREGVSWCMWSFSAVAEACSALRSGTLKYCGFEEADYSPTGIWLRETLTKYDSR
jgi:endoglucanase